MINQKFVKRKISLIQDDLEKFSEFKEYSFNEIASDFVKQAAMERFLERIINRAIDVNQHLIIEKKNVSAPKDYAETFITLSDIGIYPEKFGKDISKSVGARNVLAHDYDRTDHRLIYSSIGDCLRDYYKYCEYILAYLTKVKKEIR